AVSASAIPRATSGTSPSNTAPSSTTAAVSSIRDVARPRQAAAAALLIRRRAVREVVVRDLDVEAARHLWLAALVDPVVARLRLLLRPDPLEERRDIVGVQLAEPDRDDLLWIFEPLGRHHPRRNSETLPGLPGRPEVGVRLAFAQPPRQ